MPSCRVRIMGKNWLEEKKPLLTMLGLQVIYAASALSAKAAFTEGVSPMVFVVYRQASATVALAPASLFNFQRGQGRVRLGIKGYSLVFLTAFIGVTLNQFLYYQGLKISPASLASAVTNIIPAITFVMAASVGLEKVQLNNSRSIAKIMGTIICVGGAISIALFKGPMLMNILNSRENWILGCLFLSGSSCCWSLWLILQVPICKSCLDPLSLSSWMCLLSTLQSAILAFFLEPDLKAWKLNSVFQLSCCLFSGVIGSAVTFYLQSWCIARRGPLFSAMFNPLCTVVVTIFAILLLHEHLYIGSLGGAVAVVIGLYVVLWGKALELDDTKIVLEEQRKSFDTYIKEPLLTQSNHHIVTETV